MRRGERLSHLRKNRPRPLDAQRPSLQGFPHRDAFHKLKNEEGCSVFKLPQIRDTDHIGVSDPAQRLELGIEGAP